MSRVHTPCRLSANKACLSISLTHRRVRVRGLRHRGSLIPTSEQPPDQANVNTDAQRASELANPPITFTPFCVESCMHAHVHVCEFALRSDWRVDMCVNTFAVNCLIFHILNNAPFRSSHANSCEN